MDQLFTVDNMRSESFLRTLCGYLSSLKDLLALEEVSHMAGIAVQEYHYPNEVTLDDMYRRHLRRRIGKNGGKLIRNNLIITPLLGPIITHLNIQYGHARRHVHDLGWLLATLIGRASHLRRLTVEFFDMFISGEECDEMNRRADFALQGVIFPKCTTLKIICGPRMGPHEGHKRVMRNLLRCFPAVECLTLQGLHFPLLSELPAPEKLRHIEVALYPVLCLERRWIPTERQDFDVNPITVHFDKLETLLLHNYNFSLTSPDGVDESLPGEDKHVMTLTTGIRWLESFVQHPPARLTNVRLENLCRWSFALMSRVCSKPLTSERDSQTLRLILNGHLISSQGVSEGVYNQSLNSVSHLRILHAGGCLNHLLPLTPTIRELQIGFSFKSNQLCNVQHHLPFLTKLVVHTRYGGQEKLTPACLESFRQHASPSGLQIIHTDDTFSW